MFSDGGSAAGLLLLGAADSAHHDDHNGNGENQAEHIGQSLDGGCAVRVEQPGQGIQDGDEAASLAGGGQQECAFGVSKAHAEHIHDGNPCVDGKGQTLQADAECTDLAHFRVGPGEEEDDLIGKDPDDQTHDHTADEGNRGGKTVALPHPVIVLGAPVEAGHRLKAVAEAQDDAEGEHHDFGTDADARQHRIRNVSGEIIEQNCGNHCQTGPEHGGRAHADHGENDVL